MKKPILLLGLVALMATGLLACKEKIATAPIPDPPPEVVKEEGAAPGIPAAETPPQDAQPAQTGGKVELANEGGKWVISNTYGAKFRVPEEWSTTIETDGISATDADDTTTVVLMGAQSDGMIQAAVSDVQKKIKIKDAKFDKTAQVVVNGFPGQSIRGTAVLEKPELDQEIQFIAYNLKMGKGAVTMMIFSEAEMYEAKKETIEGLAQTLAKAD